MNIAGTISKVTYDNQHINLLFLDKSSMVVKETSDDIEIVSVNGDMKSWARRVDISDVKSYWDSVNTYWKVSDINKEKA